MLRSLSSDFHFAVTINEVNGIILDTFQVNLSQCATLQVVLPSVVTDRIRIRRPDPPPPLQLGTIQEPPSLHTVEHHTAPTPKLPYG